MNKEKKLIIVEQINILLEEGDILLEEGDFKKYLFKTINEILDSGFIDSEDITNKKDFQIAKLVLYCSLKRNAEGYMLLDKEMLKKYAKLIKTYGGA